MREIAFDDLRVGMRVEVEYENGSMVRGKCDRTGDGYVELLISDEEWAVYRVDTCTIRLLEEPVPEPPVGTVGRAGNEVFVRLQPGVYGWRLPDATYTLTWKEVLSYGPFVELVPKENK